MTQQVNNKATLTTSVDLKQDQVDMTRRVLEEMWGKADGRLTSKPGGRRRQRNSDPMSAFVKADVMQTGCNVRF